MQTSFRLVPLPKQTIASLVGLSDQELARRGVRRRVATADEPVPCRVSLTDSVAGETVLLLSVIHLAANSPYHSSGPVFIRQDAEEALLAPGEIPGGFLPRLLSIRAYDAADMMIDSAVSEGHGVAVQIERIFADENVAYLHLHNARPGCFACRVERV